MAAPARRQLVVWSPQPRQAAFISCPIFEVFFGGARGGGKSDALLGEWLAHAARYGKNAIGLVVRRERTQLLELIERSKAIYSRLGAKWHEQDKVWRFPDGARLRFAYLENDRDADNYQGHNYTRVYVEEAGTFPSPAPIFKLMATLRSGAGVPCGMRLTGNPGGPGHHWLKARFIDPAPQGWKVLSEDYGGIRRERIYIPSRVADNAFLGDEYVANLQMSGSPELVRAWLEGDWSVIAGAFFPEFSLERHVVKPFEIPAHWLRFRAMDWGSAAPFSVGWYAVSDGQEIDGRYYPANALIKYREWYGSSEPNVGLKMTAEEVADGILAREKEPVRYSVGDPAMWQVDGGPSIAERMHKRKVTLLKADNSRQNGWDQVRQRLKAGMLVFLNTCTDTIRTLPALQHDPRKPEDVDTDGEDHAPDETRYACMSRPWTVPKPDGKPPRWPQQQTINELIRRQTRKRMEEA
jgi:hypothetical protein